MEPHVNYPQLYRWADGESSVAQQQVIEQHLATCPSCAREAQTVREMQRLLRSGRATQAPSPGFETAFWRRVAASRQPSRLTRWLEVPAWMLNLQLSHAMAGMLIALVIGGLGGAVSVVSAHAGKTLPPSLSGFDELMGVPVTSVTASYLKALGAE